MLKRKTGDLNELFSQAIGQNFFSRPSRCVAFPVIGWLNYPEPPISDPLELEANQSDISFIFSETRQNGVVFFLCSCNRQ